METKHSKDFQKEIVATGKEKEILSSQNMEQSPKTNRQDEYIKEKHTEGKNLNKY